MRPYALHLAPLACAALTGGCYVLGIDFDKTGVTTSSSSAGGASASSSATTGSAGGGPGVGGAGGGGGSAPAPDCGGIDLVDTLVNSPYYRTNGNLSSNGCDGSWDGASGTAKLAIPSMTVAAANCRVATNWFFDGRGRRYSAHLASPIASLGTAPAGVFALDTNGFEILATFHADGSLWVSTLDIGTSTVQDTGPIDIGTDRYLALRFSNDGATVSVESAAQPGNWAVRLGAVPLPFSSAFDAGSIKVGVTEGAAAGASGGSADFDTLHGEALVPMGPAVACPIESLKASFNVAGVPSTLSDPNTCLTAAGNALKLCSTNTKPCVALSKHLYELSGSRLDVQVTNISIDPLATLDVGAFAPRPNAMIGPIAQMQITATDLQAGTTTVSPTGATPTLPLFLDILGSSPGTVDFGTHVQPMTPPTTLATATLASPSIVEVRLTVPSPHACVTVDNLGLP